MGGVGTVFPGMMPVRSTAKGFSLSEALSELEQREFQEGVRSRAAADALRQKLESVRRRDEFRKARRAAGAGPATQCKTSPHVGLQQTRSASRASSSGAVPRSFSDVGGSREKGSRVGVAYPSVAKGSALSAAQSTPAPFHPCDPSPLRPSIPVLRQPFDPPSTRSAAPSTTSHSGSPRKALKMHCVNLASARRCFDDELVEPPDEKTLLKMLEAVAKIPMSTELLKETGIGVELNLKAWSRYPVRSVAMKSQQLVQMWRKAHRAQKMEKRKAAVVLPVEKSDDSDIEEIAVTDPYI